MTKGAPDNGQSVRRAKSLMSKLQRPSMPSFHATKFTLHGHAPSGAEGHGTHGTESSEEHEHVPAGLQELFFDLIFVASVIQLATFLKHNTSWDGVWQAFIVFTILWLTWLHMTFLANRFKAPLVAKVGEFLYMASTLVMAFESFAGAEHEVGLFHRAFFVAFVVNRVVLLAMYFKIGQDIELAKDQARVHIIFLALTIVAGILGVAFNNRAAGISISVIILMIEFSLYPAAHMLVHESKQLKTDVHHFNERIELWSILILGESIISLVAFPPEIEEHQGELYVTEVLAFVVVYLLLQIQTLTQPAKLEAAMDEHALDLSFTHASLYGLLTVPLTFGIFLFGTGLKLMVQYGLAYQDAKKWDDTHAWILTGGLALGLVFTVFRQMTHEWCHVVFNKTYGRSVVYSVKFVVSVAVAPLALLVNSEKEKDYSTGEYKYSRAGVAPAEFMGYILLFVAGLLAMEALCLEDDDDLMEYGIYTRAVEKALELLEQRPESPRPKKVNRWRQAYDKLKKKDTIGWDSIYTFAVQTVKQRQQRSKIRSFGNPRTLRYTGPTGLVLRQVLKEYCAGGYLDEDALIEEFSRIILAGVRKDSRVRRVTQQFEMELQQNIVSTLADPVHPKFSVDGLDVRLQMPPSPTKATAEAAPHQVTSI